MSLLLRSLLFLLLCCYAAENSLIFRRSLPIHIFPGTHDGRHIFIHHSPFHGHGMCEHPYGIQCKTTSNCISIFYICDSDNDCNDLSDENDALCREYRDFQCERNKATCRRLGRSDCISIIRYCEVEDPPCEGDVDRRLCKMIKDKKIQDLDSIVLENNTMLQTTVQTTVQTIVQNTVQTTVVPVPPSPPSTLYTTAELDGEFKHMLESTIQNSNCPYPYTSIGDQCVSVFFMGSLTWMESRIFCQGIGGDLFTIKHDLSHFLTVLQHLRKTQVTNDFWVGGMYKNATLGWQWIDATEMPMGSPLWAVRHSAECSSRKVTSPVLNITRKVNDGYCYHNHQAPSTTSMGRCTAITYQQYYHMSDEDCMTRKSPLCVLPKDHPKQAL